MDSLLLTTKQFLASSKVNPDLHEQKRITDTDSTFLFNYFILRWCQTQWRYGKDRVTKAMKSSSLPVCIFLFHSDW